MSNKIEELIEKREFKAKTITHIIKGKSGDEPIVKYKIRRIYSKAAGTDRKVQKAGEQKAPC